MPPAEITFLLFASALGFLIQAGFCLIELGFSRVKNVINSVMKNVCDMSVGTLDFFFVGFGLMFSWSQGGVVGWLAAYYDASRESNGR